MDSAAIWARHDLNVTAKGNGPSETPTFPDLVLDAAERVREGMQNGTLGRSVDHDPAIAFHTCTLYSDGATLTRARASSSSDHEPVEVDQSDPERHLEALSFALLFDYTGNRNLASALCLNYARDIARVLEYIYIWHGKEPSGLEGGADGTGDGRKPHTWLRSGAEIQGWLDQTRVGFDGDHDDDAEDDDGE